MWGAPGSAERGRAGSTEDVLLLYDSYGVAWTETFRLPKRKKTERAEGRKSTEIEALLKELHEVRGGEAESEIRSLTLGAYSTRGLGLTKATFNPRHGQLLDLVSRLAGLRPEADFYSSITIKHLQGGLRVHTDGHNARPSWIIGCGSYEGGELWCQSNGGSDSMVDENTGQRLWGRNHDVKGKWVKFDGQGTASEERPEPLHHRPVPRAEVGPVGG
eukprot:3833919-Amphidinium_carterae.2